MKGIFAALAVLATINALQAKELDLPRGGERSFADPARQLTTSSTGASRSEAERLRRDGRGSAGFSAKRIVPDICTGC